MWNKSLENELQITLGYRELYKKDSIFSRLAIVTWTLHYFNQDKTTEFRIFLLICFENRADLVSSANRNRVNAIFFFNYQTVMNN